MDKLAAVRNKTLGSPTIRYSFHRGLQVLATAVNRQPATIQCAYDPDLENFQDVEISMIRRAAGTSQSLVNSGRPEERTTVQMRPTLSLKANLSLDGRL